MQPMVDPTPFRRPVNWQNLRADEAEKIIKERAEDSGKVQIIGHPQERSDERTILAPDIYRILREGMVVEQPAKNENGDWEVVIQRRMRGTRDAGAATIILTDSDWLIVKTVMWIDR
jgi:hypothetical protein